MRTIVRGLALALASCAMLLASACGTLNEIAGGSGELSLSPRTAALAAADKVAPVLEDLTGLIANNLVADNVTDDIAQFGPEVRKIIAAYFDGAEACTTSGGQLVPDAAVGRICEGGGLNAIYDQLDALVWRWAIKTGLDTREGQVIAAGRLVVQHVVRPSPGGPFPGYRDEPDVPLAAFRERRAVLSVKFDALLAAASAHARREVTPRAGPNS